MNADPRQAVCVVRALSVVLGRGAGAVRALDRVDLVIRPGERVAVVGESGSGKTTLALAIARLLGERAQCEGTIHFNGRDISSLNREEARALRGASIGVVFQDPHGALNPLMRIEDQVAEAWTAHGRLARAEALERARAALARVGLDVERHARAYPHELSGGMRQRVQIAMALAHGPALLILDEPTTALDTVTQKRIFDLIDELRAAQEFAVLLITHDLPLAVERADRIVALERGRVLSDRSAADVEIESPRAPRPQGMEARRNQPRLDVLNLGVSYSVRSGWFSRARGPRIIDGVSLAIAPGEALALVGNSGSGKTTLVRAILRLVEADDGAIFYRRQDAGDPIDVRALSAPDLRAVRPDFGIVFQDPVASLDPRRRARQVLRDAHLVRADDTRDLSARIARSLDEVGLERHHLDRFPHQLSGGEAQRLCLARALATDPRVLVLDEALASLDPATRKRILDVLERLRAERGLACLLVTHDLGSVAAFADRVAVLVAGRIVESGPNERVFTEPRHAATRALLDARPGSGQRQRKVAPQDLA
ncbi:MAG: ABC transporter ATP-binding protein [Planctomycetes bacterium]|nr:ABC transporter ATP-binding protein [Planctomycetota bacterium]